MEYIQLFTLAVILVLAAFFINQRRNKSSTPEVRPDPLQTDPRAKVQQAALQSPYNKGMSAIQAKMLVQAENYIKGVSKDGPTAEIRDQAAKVLDMNYELKVKLDEPGLDREKDQIMKTVHRESKFLAAMIAEFRLKEGTIIEDDIPPELRVAIKEYRLAKIVDVQNLPDTDVELGANLDFNMPAFGTFDMDEMK